jgi:hypothetical protein
MNQEEIMIENGIKLGDLTAFKLFEDDSPEVDLNSAILSCMSTCIAQLSLRGFEREFLLEQFEHFYQFGQDLHSETEE